MIGSRLRRTGPLWAEPDHVFRALFSYSGLSPKVVVILGLVSVIATGFIEWAGDLPIPNDIVFVLIVGGVTFHASAVAGSLLALLAGIMRVVSSAAPSIRPPSSWPIAATEGVALVALLLGFVLVARALHRAIDNLHRQASHDALTGALNTRGLMEIAERERLRAVRNGQPLTITYFDIDGLKKVNDEYGHPAGDRLLLEFVEAVVASIRPYDIFARLGGDEFVLMLPATGRRDALSVVTRIRHLLASRPRPLSVSTGVVTYSVPDESLQGMLQAADRLMYKAKQAGGDRLVGNLRFAEVEPDRCVELTEMATDPV